MMPTEKKTRFHRRAHNALLNRTATFSFGQLFVFAIVFAAIGGYLLWHSYAASSLLWSGDWETGDFSQYNEGGDHLQCDLSGSSAVPNVTSPVLQGRYAAAFTTPPFDGTNRSRCQTYLNTHSYYGNNGQENWFGFGFMIKPGSTLNAGGWNNIISFHHANTANTLIAPDHFAIDGTDPNNWKLYLTAYGGNWTNSSIQYQKSWTSLATITTGTWYQIVYHVKWSSDPNVGFVEAWVNGKQVVPMTNAATLYTSQGSADNESVYLKVGYDGGGTNTSTTVYHDADVIATDFNSAISEFPSGYWGTTSSAAPTATLTASPTSISSGGSSTLSWGSTNATSCSGTNFSASGTSGSVTVSPAATTTYTVTCTGSGGSTSASATVTVSGTSTSMNASSSIVSGSTLTCILPWIVTTSAPADHVDYYVNNNKIGSVSNPGGTSFTYSFNTSSYTNATGGGFWVMDAANNLLYRSPAIKFKINPCSTSSSSSAGLSASYFSNATLSGSPSLTRLDPNINFSWAKGTSPAAGLPTTQYSVRWTGSIKADYTGTYSFTTSSDDGIRVWVNNTQIINDWTDHYPTTDNGTISLVGGQTYQIKVEYYNGAGGGVAQLSWLPPTPSLSVVPSTALTPQ